MYLRESRLRGFIEPIRQSWQNEEFKQMSSSFGGFCNLLGLQKVGPYMQAKQAWKLEDWSAVPLDEEGKRIQEEMTAKFQVSRTSLESKSYNNLFQIAFALAGDQDYACSVHREAQKDRTGI